MERTPIASTTSGILGSFFNGLLGMGCIACSLVTTMIRPDPPGGAAFDAFPADDQRQQSGVAEDLGHSPAFPVLAEEVSFELVGIDDARRSDVGHCPQAAQVRDLVRSELPSHRRSFPYETTYAAEAGSPWRFPWDAGLSDGRPLEGEEPEGPGASVRPFRRWRSPCGT